MQTRALLLCALLLSLTACATSGGSAAPPEATDLQVFRLGLRTILAPRPIEGPHQHLDEAPNVLAGLEFGADAEEAHWSSEADKARGLAFAEEGVEILQEARRLPCRWWQMRCRLAKRKHLANRSAIATPAVGLAPVAPMQA